MLTRVRNRQGTAAADPFFDGVDLTPVTVDREGRAYSFMLPFRYYDWTMMFANFPAPTSCVRAVLPSRQLAPVEILPGLSVVTLVAFEYRVAEGLERYNEVAVMMPVRCQARWNVPFLPLLFPQWFPDFGFWVEHLPVTTQAACDAGLEIWGFPKVVSDITFDEAQGVRTCRWRADDQDILTFEMPVPSDLREQRMNFLCYPRKGGFLGRTLFQTKAPYFETRWPGGARFRIGAGDHDFAKRLRSLGMWRFAIGRIFAPTGLSMLHGPSEQIPL